MLPSIIEVTGWVCPDCTTETRLQLRLLKSGLAKLAEEVDGFKEEIQHLQPKNAVLATIMHRGMADKLRRKNIVVVRGLYPRADTDNSDLFLQLCEDYLQSSKPYVHRDKCARPSCKVICGSCKTIAHRIGLRYCS